MEIKDAENYDSLLKERKNRLNNLDKKIANKRNKRIADETKGLRDKLAIDIKDANG
jgi:hypothetical protein